MAAKHQKYNSISDSCRSSIGAAVKQKIPFRLRSIQVNPPSGGGTRLSSQEFLQTFFDN
jgi:hypothetical protein